MDDGMTMGEMAVESVRQWARVYGADHADRAWLLHDRDVWVANPSYRGPVVQHPEEAASDADYAEAAADIARAAHEARLDAEADAEDAARPELTDTDADRW